MPPIYSVVSGDIDLPVQYPAITLVNPDGSAYGPDTIRVARVAGDGVTDDLAAINSAVLAAADAGGGRAHVPYVGDGICLVTGPVIVRSGVTLTIDHNVEIRLAPGASSNILQNAAVAVTGSGAVDGAVAAGSQDVTSAGFTAGNVGQPFTLWGAGVGYGPLSGTVTGVGTGSLAHSRTVVGTGTTLTAGEPALYLPGANFTSFDRGRLVVHANVPVGTYILDVLLDDLAVMSAVPTATVSNASITITGAAATNAVVGSRVIADAVFSNPAGVGTVDTAAGSLTAADVGVWVSSSKLNSQTIITKVLSPTQAQLSSPATSTGAAAMTTKPYGYVGIGPRDRDFAVIGGIWNPQENDGLANVQSYMCKFRRADNWKFSPQKVIGGKRNGNACYAVNPGDCSRFDIDVDLDVTRDGVHVSGPCSHFSVRARGSAGDDFATATIGNYPVYMDCIGPIEDGDYDLDMQSADSGFCAIGASQVFWTRGIRVNLKGSVESGGGNTVRIQNDLLMPWTLVDDLTIQSDKVRNRNGTIFLGATQIKNLVVNDYRFTGNTYALRVASGVVDTVVMNDLHAEGTGNQPAVLVDAGAELRHIIHSGLVARLMPTGRVWQNNGSQPMRITCSGHDIQPAGAQYDGWMTHQPTGAGAMTITLGPGLVRNLGRVLSMDAATTLILAGSVLDSNNYLAFTLPAAALRVIAGSVHLVTANDTRLSRYAGSTASCNGATFRTNLALWDTPQAGDLVYNTNAAAGAGVGLNHYDGTAWQLLSAVVRPGDFPAKGAILKGTGAGTYGALVPLPADIGKVLTVQADGDLALQAGTASSTHTDSSHLDGRSQRYQRRITTLGPWGGCIGSGSVTVTSGNDAMVVELVPDEDLLLAKLDWISVNLGGGNYDIGVYDNTGAALWRKGSTAFPAVAQINTETLASAVQLDAGTAIHIAFALSTTGSTVRGSAYLKNEFALNTSGVRTVRRYLTSLPLPASFDLNAGFALTTVPLVGLRA